MYDTAAPYIASFVILRRGNLVAFVLREHTPWMNGYYGLPSGKIEKGEPTTHAAIREAKEEVGIDLLPENLKPPFVLHRQSDDSEWVDFVFEATAWQGEPVNAEPDKHARVDWLDTTNLPENVIPPVRFAIEQIAAGKRYAEYGWPE